MQRVLAAIGIIAALIFCAPTLEAALIFDRQAIASGQWWRLFSSSVVHLSPTHLLFNLVALALTAALASRDDFREALTLALLVAAASGLHVWFAAPELRYFGGLSGVATALFVYANLRAMHERRHRWLHGLLIALAMSKVGAELSLDTSLAQAVTTQPFRTIPAVHAIGIAIAFALYGYTCARAVCTSHRRAASGASFPTRSEA